MHLDMTLGSVPNSGRKRPYKIGGPVDVEAAQSMYPSLTAPMRAPRGEIMGLASRLGHL